MSGTGELVASWNASTNRWAERAGRLRVDTTGTDVSTVQLGIALGALGRGDRALADSMLRGIVRELVSDSARLARTRNPQPGDVAWNGVIRIREHTLRAMLLAADGRRDSALTLLRKAGVIEQSVPVEFGPPTSFKPPHEVAGEILFAMDHAADAESEFKLALARTPRRPMALIGLARALKAQGKTEEAARAYAELVQIWQRADDGIADVVEARAEVGSRD